MQIAENSVILMDSNIWLYAFVIDPNHTAKRTTAKSLFAKYDIVITHQIINEVPVNMLRRGSSEAQLDWIIRMML